MNTGGRDSGSCDERRDRSLEASHAKLSCFKGSATLVFTRKTQKSVGWVWGSNSKQQHISCHLSYILYNNLSIYMHETPGYATGVPAATTSAWYGERSRWSSRWQRQLWKAMALNEPEAAPEASVGPKLPMWRARKDIKWIIVNSEPGHLLSCAHFMEHDRHACVQRGRRFNF